MVTEKESHEKTENTLFDVTLRAVRSENIYLSINDIALFLGKTEATKQGISHNSEATLQTETE